MLEADRQPQITFRQVDVLALLALGCTAARSAHVLGVSKSTVDDERRDLRETMGAQSLPHLVAIAYEFGLLPLKNDRYRRLAELIARAL